MTEYEWLNSKDPTAMISWLNRNPNSIYPTEKFCKLSNRKIRLLACACTRRFWHKLHDKRSRNVVEVAEKYADDTSFTEELIFAHRDAGDVQSVDFSFSPVVCAYECGGHIDRLVNSNSPVWRSPSQSIDASSLIREVVGNPFLSITCDTVIIENCHICDGIGWYNELGPDTFPRQCWQCEGRKTFAYPRLHSWIRNPTVLSLAEATYNDRPGRKCGCWGVGTDGKPLAAFVCPDCHGTGHVADGLLDPLRLMVLADALEESGCDNEEILQHLRGFERCPECLGSLQVMDDKEVKEVLSQAVSDEASQVLVGAIRSGIICTKVCSCKNGYIPKRGPCIRGCWVLDLLLGKN